jgi:iron(III) transport system ATP-binding protein
MNALELSHLKVLLGNKVVLDDLSFSLAQGQIAALLGPSGCGKTTLLRSIAGLIRPSEGQIRFGKQLVSFSSIHLPAHKRKIGYVPQEGALFPHLTISENIAFGINRNEFTKDQIRQIMKEMLALTGMEGYGDRLPHQLSGGQQTRIALARALAIKPSIVLLDEPFSALDAELRAELRTDVIKLLRSQNTTAILVTHDREESLVSADVIALMRDGKILQSGTPEEVYSSPISPNIATSTGDALILQATELADGTTNYVLNPNKSLAKSLNTGHIVIRPEEIKIKRFTTDSLISGYIINIDYYGHDAMVSIDIANEHIQVRIPAPFDFAVGEEVALEHVGPLRFFANN